VKIIPTAERLKELERAEAKLLALEQGGVDNWEFYDVAMEDYNKTIRYEEDIENFLVELESALLNGAFEPSERGAGFCATDFARAEALEITKQFIEKIKK